MVDPPRILLEVVGGVTVPLSSREIREGVKIGTSVECALRLDAGEHPLVSPVHALLKEREGAVFVSDQDSAEGVFVNGVRVNYPGAPLKTGAKISLGKDGVALLVTIPGQPVSTLPGFPPVEKPAERALPGVAPQDPGQKTLLGMPSPVLAMGEPAAVPEAEAPAHALTAALAQTMLGSAAMPRPDAPPEAPPDDSAADAYTVKRTNTRPPSRPAPGVVPLPGDSKFEPRPGGKAGVAAARPVPVLAPKPAAKPKPGSVAAADQVAPKVAEPVPPPAGMNEVARAIALQAGAGARTIRLLQAVAGGVQEQEKATQSSLRKLALVLTAMVFLTAAVGGVYYWNEHRRRQEASERAWAIHDQRERERAEHARALAEALAAKQAAESALKKQLEDFESFKATADKEILAAMEASSEQKDELAGRLAEESAAKSAELQRRIKLQQAPPPPAIPLPPRPAKPTVPPKVAEPPEPAAPKPAGAKPATPPAPAPKP
jgi:hypothetical protein